ncbi:hypothetical protein TNCV_4449851 [Trichonephila clavipes]|nr:hypothetical protein TNCV_4449851 [Trichonephila clavipes]
MVQRKQSTGAKACRMTNQRDDRLILQDVLVARPSILSNIRQEAITIISRPSNDFPSICGNRIQCISFIELPITDLNPPLTMIALGISRYLARLYRTIFRDQT